MTEPPTTSVPAPGPPAPGPPAPGADTARIRASFLDAHRQEYARQVRWLLLGRVVVILLALLILLVYEEGTPRIFEAAHVTLVVAMGIAALHLAVFGYGVVKDIERFVLVGVALDVTITSLLAYFTGGILNPGLSGLFFATILAAAICISDRAGVVVASLATAVQAATALAYGWAANGGPRLPLVHPALYDDVPTRWGRVTANLIAVLLAYHGVALLASRLPYRISAVRLLYDEVIERMREGLVAIDRRGLIVLVNREACRLLNWSRPQSLIGRRFEDVLRRREDRTVLDVLARGSDVQAELTLTIRDRPPMDVEVVTTVLKGARGEVRGVVGIFRDLSQKRRLEEMERRVARLAGTEEMAMGIAHEIRTPLASIRGAVQELARQALTDPADRKLAEIVRRESDRLDRILQQFLDYARMRPPAHAPLDLWRLAEETAILLAQRPDAAEVEIDCPPTGPFMVHGDADQLRQAILNVGKNALEAMAGTPAPRGRHRLSLTFDRVDLTMRKGAERALAAMRGVELAIDNDGPPITAADGERIFSPFFTTKTGGLGLGLAISQKIVRLHGGTMTADAGRLGGACFRIQLPVWEPSEEPAASATPPAVT